VKLIVMLAVTNETLCTLWEHDHACDDMTNADLQIDAAYELERFIDYQNDCQNNGNGWYRIAKSPEEARRIIADGAMAVVLGMEVDTLFNCYAKRPLTHRTECTADYVEQQIDKYRRRGVRHLFPIHLMDNGFGGAALSEDFFNFGNGFVNRELFQVRDCAPTYAFRFGEISGTVQDFLASAASTLGIPYQGYENLKAHCNARGLTKIGETAIEQLMDHKMIIDVDHMSANSRAQVFDIAEKRGYQGLVSGHTGFTDVNINDKKHEGQLTPAEVDELLELGGLLAPILNQGNLEEVQAYARESGTKVANDCGNSSKAFAQAYLYAVDKARAHAREGRVVGVGFGSDFNGLVASPSPRFGPNACNGQRAAEQTGRVDYPIDTYRDLGGRMDESVVGTRKYDINTDGFAHAGMFPDFVADLESIGLTEADLAPLFSSAEAYIELWERVEGGRP
jgi:microsomal dipeptidase-like Zn-dependent dipeptidase